MSTACAHQPFCASLPSSDSAYKLIKGDPKGLVEVVGTTLVRAALIATGIYVVGKVLKEDDPHLARNSLAGALSIEAFVLAYIAFRAHGAKLR